SGRAVGDDDRPGGALEHVSFREFLEAGEGCGESEEGAEVVGVALVAYGQSSVSEQPRDTSFDDPAVLAEFLAGFDAFAGDAHGDSLLAYPVSEFGLVVGFVGVELVRLAPA